MAVNSGSPTVVTVPAGLVVNAPFYVIQKGAGPITFAGDGVTTLHYDSSLTSRSQNSWVFIWSIGTDEYYVTGGTT